MVSVLTALFNMLSRRRWDGRRGKYKPAGQEILYVRELGGDVHIRALSYSELLETVNLAGRQTTEAAHHGAMAARLLGYGLVDPAIGHERALDLMLEHPLIAARLAERITQLSVKTFERYGQIHK